MQNPVVRPLGRKFLKCFASGTAHMFSCSAQHYAWLAHHYGISRVIIDLLSLKIEPSEFDIERNRILAGYCQTSLLRNCRRLRSAEIMKSAILIAEFDIGDYVKDGIFGAVGRSTFTVAIIDDLGKRRECTIVRDRMLAQG